MTDHKRLVEKWSACEFGIKTRVFKEHTQQTIDYILKTPEYSNEKKMAEIILSIEKHSKAVVQETMAMNNKIQRA